MDNINTPTTREVSGGGFLKFVAYLQIIGIILVVLGHSMHEHPDGMQGKTTYVYRMMYSFRMPLFIFVSGLLLGYTTVLRRGKISWTAYVSGKLKRLMVPFITLTLVTFVPRAMMSDVADDALELSWRSLAASMVRSDSMVIPFFWFLQTSFTLLVVTYGIVLLSRKIRVNEAVVYIALVVAYGALPWIDCLHVTWFSLSDTCRLALYFVLGVVYARYRGAVDRAISWESPRVLVIWASAWAVLFYFTENTDFNVVCSLCGIAMNISLAKILEERHITVLDHLRGANYIIFLLSWYLNVLCQQVLSHYTDFPWWVYSMLSLVSGIYVPWCVFRYIQRHPDGLISRAAVMLLGQSVKKK
ncbi:MAG: acyltransferase [Duncaniella sp.]|nr:acyltransferase [Duncaniella sp.]